MAKVIFGILLQRLLLLRELPLLVSLFHALNYCSGVFTDIEGSLALQALKRFGEVVDEPALSRFLEQLERPKRYDAPFSRFPPRLDVVHHQERVPQARVREK